MDIKEARKIYDNIVNFLNNRELKMAFDSLGNLMETANQIIFRDELNTKQETYRQLLHYFVEGSKDPMQTRIYNELVISLYELNDKLLQRILLK
ncbi:MAG: hypothetical protein LBE91_19210, partial [Tannerella sp.]|nr:hypothetical protein [Tannerella sp.]